MHGQHAYAKPGSFAHRRSHSIWNVVIFQVKKHATPCGHQVPHHLRSLRRIELHPDFVSERRIANRGDDFMCGLRRGYVQGDNQPLARLARERALARIRRDAVGKCGLHPYEFRVSSELAPLDNCSPGFDKPADVWSWVSPSPDEPSAAPGSGSSEPEPPRKR